MFWLSTYFDQNQLSTRMRGIGNFSIISDTIHDKTTDEKRNHILFENVFEWIYNRCLNSDFNGSVFFPIGDVLFQPHTYFGINSTIFLEFSSNAPFVFPSSDHPFLFHYSVILYLTVFRNFIFILLFSYIFLL